MYFTLCMQRCKQKQLQILQNRKCWPQVQIGSASKAIFHFWYIIFLFVQQICQNIARRIKISSTAFHLFTECMDGLFHKITEWCIKYGAIKTTDKTVLVFQLMHKCFALLSYLMNIAIKELLIFFHFVGVFL